MEQNLNHYKNFYEVAKTGNISKAAEHLYISQPAVSKSIAKLENSLGLALFIRSKKGVKLTAEGKTLYDHLKLAFDSIENAEHTLRHIGEFGMGQLRIGVSTSLCKHILLPFLQDFIEEHPHIKVVIECNPTFQTIQLLKQDKIDIGLICDTPLEKGYRFTPLRSIHDTFVTTQTYLDNLVLRERGTQKVPADSLLSSTTRLTAQGHTEGYPFPDDTLPSIPNMAGLFLLADSSNSPNAASNLSAGTILEKANLMLLDKENISRIYIDEYLASQHIEPSQILEINNMDLLIDFAAIGMGVACVVREFMDSYLENGQLIELQMEEAIPKRTIGFVHPERGMNQTALQFMESCHF